MGASGSTTPCCLPLSKGQILSFPPRGVAQLGLSSGLCSQERLHQAINMGSLAMDAEANVACFEAAAVRGCQTRFGPLTSV